MKMKLFALSLLILLTTNALAQSEGVPNVSLKNLKGEAVNIRELASSGKITVVSFWATWCSPCKKELTNYAELYDQWQEKYGVQVLAISIDDARNTAKVKAYVNGVNWPFEVLLDPNEDMKRSMNFQTVPFSMLVDQSGNIVYRHNSYVEGDEFIMEEKIAALLKK
jgi:cytochrome c biogenesis protein CcmG, thiol:disulfide interchange protein DsbE